MSGPTLTIAAAIKDNRIRKAFEQVAIKIELMSSTSAPADLRLMLLLTGPPGIGKTQAVMNSLHKCGEKVNSANPRDPWRLHGAFHQYRKERNLVIDDSDHLAGSEVCANLTKQATSPPYEVNFHSGYQTNKSHDAIPSRFKVRFNLIWISNVDYRDRSNISKVMGPHFEALVSRGLKPVWIGGTDNEIFQYTCWLATEGGMLFDRRVGQTESELAIRWFIENRNLLEDVTPRGMGHVIDRIKMTKAKPEHREMLLNELLLPEERPEGQQIEALVIPKIIRPGKVTKDSIDPGKWDIGQAHRDHHHADADDADAAA
jgi:hypothetical protein